MNEHQLERIDKLRKQAYSEAERLNLPRLLRDLLSGDVEVFRSGNWIEKVKDYLRQAKAAKDEADKQFKEACSNFKDYNL